MPGGLMNLVSQGQQNVILNGNPSKTMWKAVYQKYTNFGKQNFRLDLDATPGNSHRVCMPHPEIFQALQGDGIAKIIIDKNDENFTIMEKFKKAATQVNFKPTTMILHQVL